MNVAGVRYLGWKTYHEAKTGEEPSVLNVLSKQGRANFKNKIKEAIRCGEMADKIPGERVLAKVYGVSYMTMRKSVENLVAENVLYKIPTRGTYVVQPKTLKAMVRNISNFFESKVA